MGLDHRKIDKIGRLVVDSLLFLLLWTILALPASTFSLLKYAPNNENVLSQQDIRIGPPTDPNDPTKTYREDYLLVEETSPSSDLTPIHN